MLLIDSLQWYYISWHFNSLIQVSRRINRPADDGDTADGDIAESNVDESNTSESNTSESNTADSNTALDIAEEGEPLLMGAQPPQEHNSLGMYVI